MVNVLAYVHQASPADAGARAWILDVGLTPAAFSWGPRWPRRCSCTAACCTWVATCRTSGFGDNVEDRVGHGRFLVFYLLCGTAAAPRAQTWTNPDSPIP